MARVTLPDGGRKAHYGKTAKEACEQLKQAQSELEQGIVLRKSGRLTVGQFLDDWLGWLKASEAVKARTWESYESICRVRVPAEVRMILLAKLQLADLQNLYAALKARGLSTRSVQHTHRCLHTALGHAVDQGLILRNPGDRVRLQAPKQTDFTVWSAAEAQTFLAAVADEPEAVALYTLALTTGMRLGELLGSGWDHVDLAGGSLRVVRTLRWRDSGPVFDTSKTKQSRRTVSLSKRTVEALQRWRDTQAFARRAAGAAWVESGVVFTSPTGEPLKDWNVTPGLKRAAKAAGVPVIRFHDLRHTAATLHFA